MNQRQLTEPTGGSKGLSEKLQVLSRDRFPFWTNRLILCLKETTEKVSETFFSKDSDFVLETFAAYKKFQKSFHKDVNDANDFQKNTGG